MTGEAHEEAILAALTAVLQPLPGMGRVYDQQIEWVPSELVETLLGVPDGRYGRGWGVHYWCWDIESTEEERHPGGETQVRHTCVLHGYKELAWDTRLLPPTYSRKEFRQLKARVLQALRQTITLGEVAELIEAPQLRADGRLAILDETYLCHEVEIAVIAQELLRTGP